MNREWPTRDLLAYRVESTPEDTALVEPDGIEVTYARLDARVDRVTGRLAGAGVESGDRVATLLTGGTAFVELIHATMRRRATLVPLNVEQPPGTLADQLGAVEPGLVVCDADTAGVATDIVDTTLCATEPVEGVRSLDDVARPGDRADPDRIARDWTQLVLFTSGTTGEPQGVELTTGNLVASATASAFRLGVDPDDRWLAPLPMYHMGGLAPVIRSALYSTAVVLQDGFDAQRTAGIVTDRAVSALSLVPTMLVRLLDEGWTPPERLRFVLLGGAPASHELVERAEAAGVPVCPTYGMTETASQVATARPDEAIEHPGTVGRPLGNTTVALLDADGEPVDAGERGELVVSGPTVTPGYIDDAATGTRFDEAGFHTGDLGYRDADGRLWVEGRLDDAIVTGGETVQPSRVRDTLLSHPAVADAAVVGLADDEWGERVAALVVPAGDPPGRDGLDRHCEARLASFERPRTIEYADELPRTASGTVDRESVRERLSEG